MKENFLKILHYVFIGVFDNVEALELKKLLTDIDKDKIIAIFGATLQQISSKLALMERQQELKQSQFELEQLLSAISE